MIENDSLIGESMEVINENEQGTKTFKRDNNMEESIPLATFSHNLEYIKTAEEN